jgi:chorismate mutase/prephenate dehydratase
MNNTAEKVRTRRDEINAIDSEILDLLNRRAEIALWVGAMKSSNEASLCDETRERDVLERLCNENAGPLDEQGVRNIFQRVIDESLYLQQKAYQKKAKQTAAPVDVGGKHVAVLGEPGTFSEEAALSLLGQDCSIVWRHNFDDLFHAMDHGEAAYILAPLENSLVGPINRCYDLLFSSGLRIVAEIFMPVPQFLIAGPTATIGSIRTVESHPAALGQCEMFFTENPHLVRLESDDTASSVRRAIESGDPTRAAIGSRRAAEIYGGKILRENIEDHQANWTRFVLLSNVPAELDHGEKLSLVVRLKHKPGSLHSALRPFVRRGINLLKLESRPVKGEPSKFSFYFELEAPAVENELTAALAELKKHSEEVRHLGRYSTVDMTKANIGLHVN